MRPHKLASDTFNIELTPLFNVIVMQLAKQNEASSSDEDEIWMNVNM